MDQQETGTETITTVCVDAAGGDRPVSVVLEGVARALEADPLLKVVLTGPEEHIVPFSQSWGDRCEACSTTQIISMDEHPAEAVRAKRDSSIVVGLRLVREGKAQGFFSAGSTGAVMTAATLGLGRIKGIDRPAITAVFPGPKPTVYLDLGANADCKPDYLVQFAKMGVAYSQVTLGIDSPTVALLNIGSEDTKGSLFAQSCFAALKDGVPEFMGNAEGNDILAGKFDVIVTDGFTGNAVLKGLEGTAKYILGEIMASFKATPEAAEAGKALLPSIARVSDALRGDAFGGAILLGVKGVVAIGHGATSPEAVKNGTLVVARAARAGLVQQITDRCGY